MNTNSSQIQSFEQGDTLQTQVFCEDSIETVIARYESVVFGIAMTHTGNRSDADDVFQEVFLVYHRKKPAFHDEEHRKAWLIRTTINCAKRVGASSWRRKTVPLEEAPEQSQPFQFEEENQLFEAMQKLPEKYRTVMHLFYVEEFPIIEISRILRIRTGTVKVQLSRAREMIRKQMSE